MTAAGTANATRAQILKALHITDTRRFTEMVSDFQQTLNATSGVKLSMANNIFPAKNFPLKDEFCNIMKDSYRSFVIEVPSHFRPPVISPNAFFGVEFRSHLTILRLRLPVVSSTSGWRAKRIL
jgi:serine protease inhibitor